MEPMLAEVRLFAFEALPKGWAPCEGQIMVLTQNTALFSLLGHRFGGDGKLNFALPDLRNKAPEGLQYCIALQGHYPDRG
jgi:microcystin-dependent protein